MITEHDAGAITTAYVMTPRHPLPSVARITTEDELALLGVPASTPPEVNVNPAGSVPLTIEKVYGPVPPRAVSV